MDTFLYTGFPFKLIVSHSNTQKPLGQEYCNRNELFLAIKNDLRALKWLVSILKLKLVYNIEKTPLKASFATRYFL